MISIKEAIQSTLDIILQELIDTLKSKYEYF
jgi:hypothetical protein